MKKLISLFLLAAMLTALVPAVKAGNAEVGEQVISAGQYHSAVINAKGKLYTFGLNASGQLGTGDTENRSTPVKVMDNARIVSCGGYTTAVIDDNNDLYMFGRNKTGMFGNGTYEGSVVPVKVLSDVKAVSVGTLHTAVITTDNRLLVAGSNTYGQLGTGDTDERITFTETANNVMSVSCGHMHTAFITLSHELYTFGANIYGQLMYSEGNNAMPNPYPRLVNDNAQTVSCGYNITYFTDCLGRAYGAGSNVYGTVKEKQSDFECAPTFLCEDAQGVSAGKNVGCVITKSGQMLAFGYNYYGQLGVAADSIYTHCSCTLEDIYSVSFGREHTLALTNDGRVLSFGVNTYGQLGTSEHSVYAQNGYMQIGTADYGRIEYETGFYIDCGKLYTWGSGNAGQLGNGRMSTTYKPECIAENIKSASIGRYHGAAITENGGCLWWGSLYLDHGFAEGYERRQKPHVIMSDCRDVSCGYKHTGIITSDDKLYMFGCNGTCQIGGTDEFIGSPRYITDDVKKCIASTYCTFVLKNSGELYICGMDEYGLFGTANQVYKSLHRVAENVDDIGYCGGLLYAVKDKTSGWAVNAVKALHLNTSVINDTIRMADMVSCGYNFCGYITHGRLYVWGHNELGQIGVAGHETVESPVKVCENAKSVFCGSTNTLYVSGDGGAYVTGLNSTGQVGKPCDGVPIEIMDGCETHSINVKAYKKEYDSEFYPAKELQQTSIIPDEVAAHGAEAEDYDTSYHDTLDNYEKSMYDLLYGNYPVISAGFIDKLYFLGLGNEKNAPSTAAIRAHHAYMLDNPESFLLSNNATSVFRLQYGYTGEWCGYGIDGMLSLSDDLICMEAVQDEFNSAVTGIVQACEGKNAADIIAYVTDYFADTTPMRNLSAAKDVNANPYSALCKKDTELDYRAYSSALKILLDRLGFENYIVVGTKDGSGCRWNIVRMNDGKWYAIDLYAAYAEGDGSYVLAGNEIMSDGRRFENSYGLEMKYPILAETGYTRSDAPMYAYEKQNPFDAEYYPPREHKNCTDTPDSSHIYMICAEENGTIYSMTQNMVRYYGSMRKGLEARDEKDVSADSLWRITYEKDGLSIKNVKSGDYLTFDNIVRVSDEKSVLQYDAVTGRLHSDTQSLRLWSTGHNDAAFVVMHDADAYYGYTGVCFHDVGLTGDCNTDGKINTGDAALVLKYSAEMTELSDDRFALADVNADGTVNTADAVLILRYTAGIISSF